MNTSVYISTDKITAIGYTRKRNKTVVLSYVTAALPEGVMINGKITDAPLLAEILNGLRQKNPRLFSKVSLIVDGTSIMTKRLDVPRLNKRQYLTLVRDEFTDSAERMGVLVSDYHPLPPGRAILACAAEKSQIENYIETFKEAGIKLQSVHVGIQALLSFVAARPALHKTNFVLNVVDGFSMLSLIFNKGVNVFISRFRLYSENNDELIHDVLNNLSGLIQFNTSEKFDDLVFSYYLGLTKEDIENMTAFNPYPDIGLAVLDIAKHDVGAYKLDAEAHFAYLNTQLTKNSIDLIRSYQIWDKMEKQEAPKRLWILLLVGLLLIFAIPTGYFYVRAMEVDYQIASIEDYLNDEAVLAKSAALDEMTAKTTYYADIIRQLDEILTIEKRRATISKEILDIITQVNNPAVTISHFDFNAKDGSLRVIGASRTEADASAYVEMISRRDFVSTVYYTGYNIVNEGECSFSIEIFLVAAEDDAPAAPKE